MDRWLISVSALFAFAGTACAGASDSPSTGTDTGTDTSFSTSSTSTTGDDDDDSDDSSDSTSTTNDSSESTSSTGDETSGSTGCPEGEAGCACREEDPACDDGLDCVMDVCTAGLCESEADEPNDDAPDVFHDLGNYNDDEGAQMHTSQLDGPDDVDWFSYSCNDLGLSDLDPNLGIDTNAQMRVCIFLDCEIGGNPFPFNCPGGTTMENAGFEFLEGCCATDGSTIDVSSFNCPDSNDDSIIAWIRVDQGNTMQCEPYTLTYNC